MRPPGQSLAGQDGRRKAGCGKTRLARGILVAAASLATLSNAMAADQIYVFLASKHNLDYTKRSCESAIRAEPSAKQDAAAPAPQGGSSLSPEKRQVLEAAAKCRAVADFRDLARKTEEQLIAAFAHNAKCSGISLKQEQEGYDPNRLAEEMRSKSRDRERVWWELSIDYNPRAETYSWYMFPFTGAIPAGPSISGQGDTAKNAADICTLLVTRGSAAAR